MKWLAAVLVLLLLLLQYKLWLGDGGLLKVWTLNEAIEQQEQDNQAQQEKNQALEAEVRDLKQGLAAIEERARSDLGMVGKGETFFQVIEAPSSGDKAEKAQRE